MHMVIYEIDFCATKNYIPISITQSSQRLGMGGVCVPVVC